MMKLEIEVEDTHAIHEVLTLGGEEGSAHSSGIDELGDSALRKVPVCSAETSVAAAGDSEKTSKEEMYVECGNEPKIDRLTLSSKGEKGKESS